MPDNVIAVKVNSVALSKQRFASWHFSLGKGAEVNQVGHSLRSAAFNV